MEKKNRSNNAIKILDLLIFGIFLGVFGYFFGKLVYCQTLYANIGGGYFSDILAYMQHVQGPEFETAYEPAVYSTLDTYPLFFLFGKFLHRFLSIEHTMMVAEAVLNSLAIILAKYFFEKTLKRYPGYKDTLLRHVLVTLGVFACFIMSMWWLPRFGKITLPFKDQVFYGTYSGNPFHNATYIATRPFSIAAFFGFVYLMQKIPLTKDGVAENPEKLRVADFIFFGVSLLLSVLAKPTFSLVFVSSSGLVFIARLIISKGKQFKKLLLAVLCYLPTFAVLLFQFGGVFGDRSADLNEHGIGFTFFTIWKSANPHVLAAVVYANIFALVCIIFFIKDIKKDFLYRFGILFFVVSFLEAGLLFEKGFRAAHFNFGWGYMHGIFFFQMVSILMLLKECFREKKRWYAIAFPAIFLLSQVVFGILYFKGLYSGLDYNTLLPTPWVN